MFIRPILTSLGILAFGIFLIVPVGLAAQEEGLVDLVEEVGDGLIDQRGRERIEFSLTRRGVWGAQGQVRVGGWREEEEVMLDDGFVVPAHWVSELKSVDLVAAVTARYSDEENEEEEGFDMAGFGVSGDHDVANAVWMHRLGKPDLAGRALARAGEALRRGESMADNWRRDRAWFYYAGMVHGYIQGEDEEAEVYGAFLLERYRDVAVQNHEQAEALMAEIRRRGEVGGFRVVEDPGALKLEEQITYWIERLEGIDVLQDGQPGGVDFGEAESVQALIAIGDPAIPKLIDVLENDTRFTRSVHFWRAHAPSRMVLGVHEAALVAIMSILRTEFFDAAYTGDNFTGRGATGRAGVVGQLRAYWERYGALSFDERMMVILSDVELERDARREAGWNLVTPRAREVIGTTVWTNRFEHAEGENAGIAKFQEPTIAEALVAALDDELEHIAEEARKAEERGEEEGNDDPFHRGYQEFHPRSERREAVEQFTAMLQTLGDGRAGAVLAGRAGTSEDIAERCDYALVAGQLGETSAMAELTAQISANEVAAPVEEDGGAFPTVFWCLRETGGGDAGRALSAMAKVGHAWYPAAIDYVFYDGLSFGSERNCRRVPWVLDLLESALHDEALTGYVNLLRWDKSEEEWKYFQREPNGNGGLGDGSKFLNEAKYDREWPLRRCDRAVILLQELLGDHKEGTFEPLAKDREETVEELRSYMERYRGKFREMEPWLDGGTGWAIEDGRFLPVLASLGRAAKEEDVVAGSALFALGSPGVPPDLGVPVQGQWRGMKRSGFIVGGDPDAPESRDVVVLQIERAADGELWFGVADGNGFHVVSSKELGTLYVIEE